MLTRLLNAAAAGDADARREAVDQMYAALRANAQQLMARERGDHTLCATALVHEAYLRVFDGLEQRWESREQFLGYSRQCMVHLLIDHARRRQSQRRGGGQLRVGLPDDEVLALLLEPDVHSGPDSHTALDQALATLQHANPRAAQVLALRCLAGLDVPQTAAALGISERSVSRDWDLARGLLARMLDDPGADATMDGPDA